MLLDNIFTDTNDWVTYRWSMCEPRHRATWSAPNAFLETLLIYKNEIKDLRNIEVFIETGTCEALTVDIMAKYFKQIFTIENNPRIIDPRIKTDNKNIEFRIGASVEELKKISVTVKNERCVILLDAHNGYESPLSEELKTIKLFFNKQSVILVDDICDIGFGNWPTKDEFENLIYDINPNYKITYTNLGRSICLIA